MAGHGSRFSKAGYKHPKPLIAMGDKTMIEVVVNNLRPSRPHRFIFICQQEHLKNHDLASHLKRNTPACEIIPVSTVTEGAACSVLLARQLIDSEEPLMIANCDQYVEVDMDDYLAQMDVGPFDGLIMTMKANDPKWSFVRLDKKQQITQVVEKEVVSDEATVGIYNFRRGLDFVAAADSMISQGKSVNGEYYVAPVYNEMLGSGKSLTYYNIGSDRSGMFGLGTPQDFEYFMAHHPTQNR